MNMMFHRKTRKIWKKKLASLLLMAAVLFLLLVTSESKAMTDATANNSSVLTLSNNNLTLNDSDIKILQKNPNITELYLNNNAILILCNYSFCSLSKLALLDVSHNSIQTIEQAAFAGLNQLTTLYLQNNKIAHLDSSVFIFLKSLKVLNLQNNNLGYLEVSLNLIRVTLFGNPWNCSCGLLSLQSWLNNTKLTIENEKNTKCTFPDSLNTQPIKTARISHCNRREETKLQISINPSNDTGASGYNDTDGKLLYSVYSCLGAETNSLGFKTISSSCSPDDPLGSSDCAGFQPLGKSWKFLIGVLIVIVTTTMLIITAIKFPVWYRYLISYNHRRLDEDEPEMFEEDFSTDMCSFPPVPDTNENDSIVVFEQFHTFVPEEDGFIEDKYIDT